LVKDILLLPQEAVILSLDLLEHMSIFNFEIFELVIQIRRLSLLLMSNFQLPFQLLYKLISVRISPLHVLICLMHVMINILAVYCAIVSQSVINIIVMVLA